MKNALLFFVTMLLSGSFYAQYVVASGTTVTITLGTSFPAGIEIEPNAVLIVDGATLSMGPGTTILIKNRGKLVGINNARFESFPGNTWSGIEAERASLASTNANLAIDFNEVTVTGAETAIELIGTLGRERSILCKNTVFTDNTNHLDLDADVANLSATGFYTTFENCDFLAASGSWPLHIARSRFHTYENCYFDCSLAPDRIIHSDGLYDSDFIGNSFEPHRGVDIFLHFTSQRVNIVNNTFKMENNGGSVPGGYTSSAVWIGESNISKYTDISIRGNTFQGLDAPTSNNACGIYSEVEQFIDLEVYENDFREVHTGIDVDNNFGSKSACYINRNNFENYKYGIKLRTDNSKMYMSCNVFQTDQESTIGIWNISGTVLDHTGIGPMNEFLTGPVHLQNDGAFWQYSTSPTNLNPPTSIVGSILMTSVMPFENCSDARSSVASVDKEESDVLSIYPNPSSGFFSIDLSGVQDEDLQIFITDLTGKRVYSTNLLANAPRLLNLDITNQSNGVYLINIVGETVSLTQKVILE